MTLRRQLTVLSRLPFQTRLGVIDVSSFLTDICALYQQIHDIHIECIPPLYPVVANSLFLTEAVDHILSNAVKFSQPDLKIMIHSQRVEGFVQYSVTDNGRGIPPEYLEYVFEWGFHRGPPFGFGIGLPVARYLVRLMNGDIWIESQVGGGTTVWIQLAENENQNLNLYEL